MSITRRSFIAQTTAFAGLTTFPIGKTLAKPAPPSEQIRVAGIGLGPRGRKDLESFLIQPDVKFVAIADVQKERREIIRRMVNRHYDNNECKVYSNMDQVLERPDIDAVIIATGDRWHGTASIYAARAGKDIYCEKTCTMSIVESQELETAVKAAKRIYQSGLQRRNVDNFKVATELARAGKLGKLKTLHAGIWLPQPVKPYRPAEPEPDKDICDWDGWCGPAPKPPYNSEYVRSAGRWRYFEGFSAGWGLHDWASHTLNLCQWANDADGTAPVDYEFKNDEFHCRYANGVNLVMRVAGFKDEGDWLGLGSCPVRYEGDAGWVEAGDNGLIVVSDPELLKGNMPSEMQGIDPSKNIREFLDCVKSRGRTACNESVTRRSENACHAAAISWKLGKKLRFDPQTERFTNSPEANALRSYARRNGYTV